MRKILLLTIAYPLLTLAQVEVSAVSQSSPTASATPTAAAVQRVANGASLSDEERQAVLKAADSYNEAVHCGALPLEGERVFPLIDGTDSRWFWVISRVQNHCSEAQDGERFTVSEVYVLKDRYRVSRGDLIKGQLRSGEHTINARDITQIAQHQPFIVTVSSEENGQPKEYALMLESQPDMESHGHVLKKIIGVQSK